MRRYQLRLRHRLHKTFFNTYFNVVVDTGNENFLLMFVSLIDKYPDFELVSCSCIDSSEYHLLSEKPGDYLPAWFKRS